MPNPRVRDTLCVLFFYNRAQLICLVTWTLPQDPEEDLGEEHERMGLHEHVCEVQLHLNSIYKLKNDEGHKRYVEFRNRRAE